MSYLYLLDTNILSELIKNPRGVIFSKIQEVGEDKICTSIIVACESRFGARKKNSPKLIEKLEVILDSIEILPLIHPIEEYYAEIRTYLEQQGTPIGSNDLLIAAHAISLNLTVITNNVREFSRVPNLKVENWLNTN
ncbi:type II toxin-antitoxin system VapC family toxin [Trichormus sp. NMC-1]|uniref:type II toxin-antitoxin system VapC family toxin n=1 Tax=Trichormus sp. NMC-1 TaxID=1853259 RepID=UPI0008DBEBC1|nr:type II toxin-antitoxin system VapC family toxin [Trichormus sp. NMC-1]